MIKVSSMISPNGNPVANQFLITGISAKSVYDSDSDCELPSGEAFQSYRSLIAYRSFTGKLFLDKNKWDYSRTTLKYLKQFCGMNKAEILKKIEAGEIQLINMND